MGGNGNSSGFTGMSYDLSRAPSSYVENDMEMLRRLEAQVRIVIGG